MSNNNNNVNFFIIIPYFLNNKNIYKYILLYFFNGKIATNFLIPKYCRLMFMEVNIKGMHQLVNKSKLR